LKKYFITGLLIWVPLGITLWVLALIVRSMDQTLTLLPHAIQPERLMGFYLPGLGMVLTLLVIFFTGLVTTNIIGQKLVRFWESLLARIPIVKSLYYAIKQVSDTLFSHNGEAFRKVLLVRYPHPQAWSIAFQTGSDRLPDRQPGARCGRHVAGRICRRFYTNRTQPGEWLLFFRAQAGCHGNQHEH